ncbi:MAG: NUDIX domain-containing protein [Parcubacteria group bacterium]|jgi:8-oxo-dGTP diphosphatase
MLKIACKNNFDKIVDVPADKFVFRPSAYGVIVQDDRVLMLRNRSNGKLWFPGGGVDIGEKIDNGLYREMQDETGLQVEINNMVLFKENFFTINH